MDEHSYFENVASYRLLAKKEVGQNFLIDASAAKAIVDALGIEEGDEVLEIGCGLGSLTYFLAQHEEARIEAIDIDEAMLAKTGEDFSSLPHVNVHYGNAARWDYGRYDKIVGNLPYYITSLILEKALLGGAKAKTMVFMVQKEAGERIVSKPKTKDYSPLAILLSLCYETKKIRTVGRASFAPAPHVESSVYTIRRKEGVSLQEGEGVYRLALSLFAQRRKTLYNNLKTLLGEDAKAKEAIASCGLSMTIRPEEVTPQEFLNLYRQLQK